MKTRKSTFLLMTAFLLVMGCGNSFENKYADKEDTITCNNATIDNALYKEALYSFEDYLDQINSKQEYKDIIRNYTVFLNQSLSNRPIDTTKISDHDVRIFNELKKNQNLWANNNGTYRLNYKSDLVTCLGDNIMDEGLRTTFKALISTNSMTPKLFTSALQTKLRTVHQDKYLATYIALEMFYPKFFNLDLNNLELIPDSVKFPKEDPNVPKTPPSATPKRPLKPAKTQ